MQKTFFILSAGVILVLAGCQNASVNTNQAPEPENLNVAVNQANTNSAQPAGIANPASANCIAKGGKLEMRTNKNGQYGVCLFEDNRQCEEWALMNGKCPEGGVKVTGYDTDAEIYCAITGGQVGGRVGTATPMCKRFDGTLCNAQANLDGECPDPYDPNPNAGNVEAP